MRLDAVSANTKMGIASRNLAFALVALHEGNGDRFDRADRLQEALYLYGVALQDKKSS